MNKLTFIGVSNEHHDIFHTLMKKYADELDEHQHRNTDPEILRRWTDSIIDRQSDKGRYLRLCCAGDDIIGFIYSKTDCPDDRGYKRVGWGYIMEFYVIPKFRRKGYGRRMYSHLEGFFKTERVNGIYLTADPVTGKPFWEVLGFESKGELSPDNGQEIYEKTLSHENTGHLHVQKATAEDAVHISTLYTENVSALHGSYISTNEWHTILSDDDPDELHLLIYSGNTPAAWIKLNGLATGDDAWISMLAVSPAFQRQGIGRYAVSHAEEYCISLGRKKLFVKTTADNTPAQMLYQKCFFTVTERIMYTTGDGTERNGIVYSKYIR